LGLHEKFKHASFFKRLIFATKFREYPKLYHIDKAPENSLVEQYGEPDNLLKLKVGMEEYSSRLNLPLILKKLRRAKLFKKQQRLPHYLIGDTCDESLYVPINAPDYIKSNFRVL